MNICAVSATRRHTEIEPFLYGRAEVKPSRRKRALLAEDNVSFRRLILRVLTTAGLPVRECSTGLELAEALDDGLTFPHQLPDVVITDISMPGYTGLEVLDALRELNDSIPVILMTGLSDHNLSLPMAKARGF